LDGVEDVRSFVVDFEGGSCGDEKKRREKRVGQRRGGREAMREEERREGELTRRTGG